MKREKGEARDKPLGTHAISNMQPTQAVRSYEQSVLVSPIVLAVLRWQKSKT